MYITHCLILGAGYATRLRPLTLRVPKPLLPIGDRPVLDRILETVWRIPSIEEVIVVTNHAFADCYQRWAKEQTQLVTVIDDGTAQEDDRLGAVGDLSLVLTQRPDLLDSEAGGLLVIAGDNLLIGANLHQFIDFWRIEPEAGAVAVYDVGDRELAKQYGIVTLAGDMITEFVEKPSDPPSTLASTALYILSPDQLRSVEGYLAEGFDADKIGNFIAYLAMHGMMLAWPIPDGVEWVDIGTPAELLDIDNRFRLRERRGPIRSVYALPDDYPFAREEPYQS